MSVRWSDSACLLRVTLLNEDDAMVDMITHNHGRVRAVARRAMTPALRAIYQQTNLLTVHVQARDEHALGHMDAEIITPYCALLASERWRWYAAQAASAVLLKALGEGDAASEIYTLLVHYYDALAHRTKNAHQALMLHTLMEFHLLGFMGYGLDLSCCAVTGSVEDLGYISPKTGRVVTREVAEPYRDKLFPLPLYYRDASHSPTAHEVYDALIMNSYFLRTRLFEAHHGMLPEPRIRLEESARGWLMP
ncbi:MAG: DNA repair protein RecO [Alphaproteobacteria bacterium]|jgi:DNA repair protein RecO (recombination protein O)|nr:MAG: DNA repair protein RecO [Alphaproteobacteria bacterium]